MSASKVLSGMVAAHQTMVPPGFQEHMTNGAAQLPYPNGAANLPYHSSKFSSKGY